MKWHYACTVLALILLLSLTISSVHGQGTRVGFYSQTCPEAENIVRGVVQSYFCSDATVAGGLLRMHFHDCFILGCDGSILIDGDDTENTAIPNFSVKGYDIINDSKAQIEAACPGVVSCADILALAARDSVVATGGRSWGVPTGCRDGRVSLAANANNLPSFRESVASQRQKFADIGLNTQDLVLLAGGGHTIGTTGCQFFSYRFANDSSINLDFLPQIRALCPTNGDPDRRIALDNGSQNRFDNSIFTNLRNGRGILESDQALWTDNTTRPIVQRFSPSDLVVGFLGLSFDIEFARSMVKMSNVGVKTGTEGEIRRVCSAIN